MNDENSYQSVRRRLKRRTLIAVTSFLIVLSLSAQVVSMVGVLGTRPPNLQLLVVIRLILLGCIVLALLLSIRDHLRLAAGIVLAVQIVGLVTFSLITAEPGFVGFLATIATAILSVQLATLFVVSLRGRLVFGGAVAIVLIAVAMWYLRIGPPAERQLLVETIVTALFMFAIVLVPSLVGAYERNQLTQVLTRIAYIDAVTGLPNATQLTNDLEEILHQVHQRESTYALFAITIHGIGKVNRRHGYGTGDRLMRYVGNRLGQMQDMYKTYRIPGATFVCAPQFDWHPHRSHNVFNELRTAVIQSVPVGDSSIELDCRIAGTIAPTDGRSAARLIHNLQNVTARTSAGASAPHIAWFEPHQYRKLERQYTIETSVRRAIHDGEFFAYIQPKVDLSTGAIHGGELLARWNHREYGAVSPGEFIPAIESEGMMLPFTKKILSSGETALHEIPEETKRNLVVAINITASSLSNRQTVEILKNAVHALAPMTLEVELTEDVFLMIDASITRRLTAIKALGIRLALDDFGTGFSNFSYLQEIHVDTLKIDRGFITPLPDDTHSYEIVRAICAMAGSFGIETVAEGVETSAQAEMLRDAGCDVVQGYLYSRPLPGEEFAAFCRSSHR